MSRLPFAYGEAEGGSGPEEAGGCWDWITKWMETDQEVGEEPERSPHLHSSNRTLPDVQTLLTSWLETRLRSLQDWDTWCAVAAVGVVWSVGQLEAPLHPVVVLLVVFWRLVLVLVLWIILGAGVHALRRCLWVGQRQEEAGVRIQQEVQAENRTNCTSWLHPSRSRHRTHDALGLALVDSLLLCVLQEPLQDPKVAHIQDLIHRLELVSQTLEKADSGSEATPKEDLDGDVALKDKVKRTLTYLQQRAKSLRKLVEMQGDFEAGVGDLLEGLGGLWAQLEDLHTGVTLNKEGGEGHRNLASAQTDAKFLFTVLGQYRIRFQSCQSHLKDTTQLLQELTWSHTHMCNGVSSSELVWPELLLQSNIEQFDKVQESFLSLEQQTSTFQAHLDGLGRGDENGHINKASPQASPQLSGHSSNASLEHRNSTSSASTSASIEDLDPDVDPPLTLCQRSALQFSSTVGRLRKSGRRKKL
ncbi:uncharacterized protein LOC115431070 [Sphaeramia orbicularis]|uniref:uncharacterized protein LOC115431070 n=1 Tax=Sphaeramia orbicularis TaxID=375764 RepID=UPI00117D90DE|nr:uncharacterized protein LOC115431070 [Sphaeramia orbicularis]